MSLSCFTASLQEQTAALQLCEQQVSQLISIGFGCCSVQIKKKKKKQKQQHKAEMIMVISGAVAALNDLDHAGMILKEVKIARLLQVVCSNSSESIPSATSEMYSQNTQMV